MTPKSLQFVFFVRLFMNTTFRIPSSSHLYQTEQTEKHDTNLMCRVAIGWIMSFWGQSKELIEKKNEIKMKQLVQKYV